ncbi:GIY-YIG nuclease family protein [Mycobacterium sp.]|uniref:GIY-YIG nuclease family protein n=1 Tax=Mycobacterium sp. TaxID=1785 RepID=UPI0025CE10C1|nr:hypothetical protein [Mycobacterium sp.]
MEPTDILEELRAARCGLAEQSAPSVAGVYAIFSRAQCALPGVTLTGGDVVYIGSSSNLAQRSIGTHFATGQSGFSTLRRSIGALLRDQLDLVPRPRGAGSSDSNFRHYRFDDAGEDKLTSWMIRNFDASVYPVPDPGRVERALIAIASPPMNLRHWANPDATMMRAARKACVDHARSGVYPSQLGGDARPERRGG